MRSWKRRTHLFFVGLSPSSDRQLGDLELGLGDFGDLAVHDVALVVEQLDGAAESLQRSNK